ncbi:MAG: helix-turn-helix domain-containing protein [Spirochaetes bacterium]|nr:helix-turn-helix domain-containing protein [Spirochaetota bacterium]
MIPALKRGLIILKLVMGSDEPLGFNEILAQTQLPPSTVMRLLKSLVEGRYIMKDARGKYCAGNELAVLGRTVPTFARLLERSSAVLKALSDATGNTAILIYWNGNVMQCIAKVIHPFSISMQELGNTTDDYSSTPWGHIFFSALDAGSRTGAPRRMFSGAGFDRLQEHYRSGIAVNGYAYEDAVVYPHIRRIAAPVTEYGRIVGAVGLGGNTLTIPDGSVEPCGKAVIEAARDLSLDGTSSSGGRQ